MTTLAKATAQLSGSLPTALAILQTKLPKVGKSKTANAGQYSYTYAGLDSISAAVLPIMGELGLSFLAKPTRNELREFVLAYKLQHTSGDTEEGEFPLPWPASPQQIGSAITYARRYTLCAVTGLVAEEDDDGKVASAPETAEPAKSARVKATTPKAGPMMSEQSRKKMFALFKDLGYEGEANQQQRRTVATKVLRRNVDSISELTEAEAFVVIAALDERKKAEALA